MPQIQFFRIFEPKAYSGLKCLQPLSPRSFIPENLKLESSWVITKVTIQGPWWHLSLHFQQTIHDVAASDSWTYMNLFYRKLVDKLSKR